MCQESQDIKLLERLERESIMYKTHEEQCICHGSVLPGRVTAEWARAFAKEIENRVVNICDIKQPKKKKRKPCVGPGCPQYGG